MAKENHLTTKDHSKKGRKEERSTKQLESKQENGSSKHLSIVTRNVNELNSLFKRHRVAEWIKK